MKRITAYYSIAAIILIIDQLTKYLIRASVPRGTSINILDFFSITNITNTGSAFGMLQNMNTPLMMVSLLAIGYLIYKQKTITTEKHLLILCGLILGGALGNLYDRIFFGAVTDFLALSFWPAFNVADSALCIGVLGLLWHHRKD